MKAHKPVPRSAPGAAKAFLQLQKKYPQLRKKDILLSIENTIGRVNPNTATQYSWIGRKNKSWSKKKA